MQAVLLVFMLMTLEANEPMMGLTFKLQEEREMASVEQCFIEADAHNRNQVFGIGETVFLCAPNISEPAPANIPLPDTRFGV